MAYKCLEASKGAFEASKDALEASEQIRYTREGAKRSFIDAFNFVNLFFLFAKVSLPLLLHSDAECTIELFELLNICETCT